MVAVLKTQSEFPEKLGLLFEPSRYKVLYGGRGGSKSWGIARALLIQGSMKPLRVLCAREVQRSIQDSVHRLLCDQIMALGLEQVYRITESQIHGPNGTLFLFAGLRHQSATNLKSYEGIDVCWVEEAQAVTSKSWDILVPTIRKPGSEIWISFNPELASDATFQRFVASPPSDCKSVFLTYRDNPWFPDVLEQERQHLLEADPEAYDNVWEGHCRATVEGAIYAKEVGQAEVDKRIRPVPYDPMLKVHTVWDLGWNDSSSIIFVQANASEVRIIDYIEDSHRTLDDYVAEINAKRYNWGADYLPHDGESKNLQTGLAPKDILRRLGRAPKIIPRSSIEVGIKAARLFFRRVYFDESKAVRLIECLKRYRRAVNANTNEPGAPVHDEFSHGADAFRGLAMSIGEMSNDEGWGAMEYPETGIV